MIRCYTVACIAAYIRAIMNTAFIRTNIGSAWKNTRQAISIQTKSMKNFKWKQLHFEIMMLLPNTDLNHHNTSILRQSQKQEITSISRRSRKQAPTPDICQPLLTKLWHSHFQMDSIKVKKMSPNAKIPKRGTPGAAGHDLFAAQSMTIPAGRHKCVLTDIQVTYLRLAKGYEEKLVHINFSSRFRLDMKGK